MCGDRSRGIPSHLLGPQPNGSQENLNEDNSSSAEDSKQQFQNNLRKFKAKCDFNRKIFGDTKSGEFHSHRSNGRKQAVAPPTDDKDTI